MTLEWESFTLLLTTTKKLYIKLLNYDFDEDNIIFKEKWKNDKDDDYC
jgi:hypothetical protein